MITTSSGFVVSAYHNDLLVSQFAFLHVKHIRPVRCYTIYAHIGTVYMTDKCISR